MRRPLGFFLLAGFAAMLAALVVYSALKKREAEVRQATMQTVNIVVAAKDLSLGAKIDPSAVKLARWPRDSVPQGSFTDPASVVGSFVKGSFVQNEPIVAAKLFTGDKTAGVMPLLIPAGMRAMSVPVDEVSDIAGFVLPRAHVDVVVAIQNTAAGTQPFSKVVLQDVEVLAVAQEMEGPKDKPHVVKVVTLLVTPEQAEKLALASREGQLRLALRNYNDNKIVLTRGVDIRQMLGIYSPGLPTLTSQAASSRHAIRMRRVKRLKTFKVEIMRDGKTDKSVSFVDQAKATRAIERGFQQTSDESGPETQPSRFAAIPGSAASDHSMRVADGATPNAKTASLGAHATANPEPEAGFGPTPKTIDIP